MKETALIEDDRVALARLPIEPRELRSVIDAELADQDFYEADLRLILASDLICEAALEVVAEKIGQRMLTKMVVLSDHTRAELSSLAVVHALRSAHVNGEVSLGELQTLLSRSATANAIASFLEEASESDELDGSTVTIAPNKFLYLTKQPEVRAGLFSRMVRKLMHKSSRV